MEVQLKDLQNVVNEIGIKVFWFVAGYFATTALRDYLTQIYRAWKVRQSGILNEGDLITIDGVHGRVLSIGWKVVKIQMEAYDNAPESISHVPISYFIDKAVRVYKYSTEAGAGLKKRNKRAG